ncbi:MAG: tRNA adenosine(34) deaminase TadA [Gammaproteobacteria bacterium]|nr:tRNA adenosine(34) deaminase TadA [Gammaproteobacteria bacterium]
MTYSEQDIAGMRAALAQAAIAESAGEVPVGAVVVVNGEVVGAGHNRSISDADPSGHAEIVALRQACRAVRNHRLTGAILYVTLEPCVMCVGAIVQARIGRVVFGAYDDKAGALGTATDLSDSKALNHRFEINGGLLAEECAAMLKDFFVRRRK